MWVLIDRYKRGREYLKKIEKENNILIEKGNKMLADVVFYENRKSDVTCLKRKLRSYLLFYIIEK